MKKKTLPSIYAEAEAIVAGPRQATHGELAVSFGTIAQYWTVYLQSRQVGMDYPISGSDVAQMMVLLKVARAATGTPTHDHFLDQIGYAGISAELSGV